MKLIVKGEEKNIANIESTKILQDQHFLYAFKGDELVGMFTIGCFNAAFLYEQEERKE